MKDALVVRTCLSCGGTPTLLPGGACYACDGTGRELFYLHECLDWIDISASPIKLAEFKVRHGIQSPRGGPRVRRGA